MCRCWVSLFLWESFHYFCAKVKVLLSALLIRELLSIQGSVSKDHTVFLVRVNVQSLCTKSSDKDK